MHLQDAPEPAQAAHLRQQQAHAMLMTAAAGQDKQDARAPALHAARMAARQHARPRLAAAGQLHAATIFAIQQKTAAALTAKASRRNAKAIISVQEVAARIQ